MENIQLERWSSDFGEKYLSRNASVNFSEAHCARTKEHFKEMLDQTKNVKRILEVGCNTGHNFTVLSQLGDFELVGIEPQVKAIQLGKEKNVPATLVKGSAYDIPFFDGYFDLVFASGVLMHISPDSLPKALKEIDRVTRKYFFTTDYFDEAEVDVHYHGHDNMLWRRDMQKACAEVLPHMRLILKKQFDKQDERTGKYTYGLLFEKT